MALRAAGSLMSYTGPGGCNHSRPVTENEDGSTTADPEWILECGNCEASLAGHELWGPHDAPRPLTADEIRLRDAQQADATRNLWQGLANMPEQLAALAAQNSVTMAILAKMLGVEVPASGLPALPAAQLPVPAPAAAEEPKTAAKKTAAKKTAASQKSQG